MLLKLGNIWNSKDDIIAVTTNSVLNNGRLVMGAGTAKQAKQRYPELPALAGYQIKEKNAASKMYGWMVIQLEKGKIGLFQTKTQYQYDSSLEIIEYSCNQLIKYLESNAVTVSLPFPGVGYGNLSKDVVLPIIRRLPDSVTVYEKSIERIINSKTKSCSK